MSLTRRSTRLGDARSLRAPAALSSACLVLLALWPFSAMADPARASLSEDVQPILDAYCVQCHMREVAQGGLVLEQGEARRNLVGIKSSQSARLRVSPGAPEASYLVDKLQGTQVQAGGSGSGMPLVEGAHRRLREQDIQTVIRWIADGAKDD